MRYVAGVGMVNCDLLYSGIPHMPREGEDALLGQFAARKFHVAEAVKGELGRIRHAAPASERIRRLGAAQIFRVEIAVYEQLAEAHGERAFKALGRRYFRNARNVLPEIIDEPAVGSADDLFDGQPLRRAHKFRELSRERPFIEENFHGGERRWLLRQIDALAAVNARLFDKRSARRKALVGGKDGIPEKKIGADRRLFSIAVFLHQPEERALVPALADDEGNDVLPLFQQRGDVVFLHLQGVVIGRPAGRQICVPYPLSVEISGIEAERRRPKDGGAKLVDYKFAFEDKGVHLFPAAHKFPL